MEHLNKKHATFGVMGRNYKNKVVITPFKSVYNPFDLRTR